MPIPAFAAALRRRIAEACGHKAAALQPLEPGIDRAWEIPRSVRISMGSADVDTPRLWAELRKGQEEQLLLLAQVMARHLRAARAL